MATSNVIRAAREEDLGALTGLLQELFSLEADFTVDGTRQAAGLKLLLHKDDAIILVAERAGKVAGMCSVQTLISTAQGSPVGLLEDMVVFQGARRQGIGKALLQSAESWAAERGLMRLQLLAEFDNEAALKFYFKCGWHRTGLICQRKMIVR